MVIRPLETRVQDAIDAHDKAYAAADSENVAMQHKLMQLRAASTEIDRLSSERDTLKRKLADLGDTSDALTQGRQRWREVTVKQHDLLVGQAKALTDSSEGVLRVVVESAGDCEDLRASLVDVLRGSALTVPEKFDKLKTSIKTNQTPLTVWLEIALELLELARVGSFLASGAALPACANLASAGFTPSELKRMALKITKSAAFELSLLRPSSTPRFEYKFDDGTYIPFEQASPGQQANALLTLLFNQAAGPLLIDQPEDDLDNSTVHSISEKLWPAKQNRQLMFSTHNPNLLVIGDAELMVHCDYVPPPGRARVRIAHEGAIDNPRVRVVITQVMEGGDRTDLLYQVEC
jgi:chromosome segregation protein